MEQLSGIHPRALSYLSSYFPTRFLPVNSLEHLGTFLQGFGVPAAAVPEGAVARNRLLFHLFEALRLPRGLTALDFMHLVYVRFDPRPVKLDPQRLRGALRLFAWIYGNTGCRAPRFLEQERNYKLRVVERWQELATSERLERALADGTELETTAALRQAPIGQDRDALQPAFLPLPPHRPTLAPAGCRRPAGDPGGDGVGVLAWQ